MEEATQDNATVKKTEPGNKRTATALGAWLFLLFLLSVLPLSIPGPPKIIAPTDLIAHVVFYAPAGALAAWTFARSKKWAPFVIGVTTALAYGMAMELIQASLPWRSFEFADAGADLIGGLIGASFAIIFPNLHQRAVKIKTPNSI